MFCFTFSASGQLVSGVLQEQLLSSYDKNVITSDVTINVTHGLIIYRIVKYVSRMTLNISLCKPFLKICPNVCVMSFMRLL